MLRSLWIVLLCHLCAATWSHNSQDSDFAHGAGDKWQGETRGESCRRECVSGQKPRTCRYEFVVEMYSTMSKACYDCPRNATDCSRPDCLPADGEAKVVIVVNRQLPGPLIEVCRGDRLVVDVKNRIISETTTIHWHGIHQRGTPFMDGVPYVSQCPILPGQDFRYDFVLSRAGTYIWHSHSENQRADGLFGGLIVRAPKEEEEAVGAFYDEDKHVILMNEWSRASGPHSYILEYQNGGFDASQPHTILVNGIARFGNGSANMPLPIFTVNQGKRYRFRLINIGSEDCPLHFSIEQHTMLTISADGAPIEPIEVDSIRILSGERYDFVLAANRPIDNYWIRVTGEVLCSNINQVSILRYKGAGISEPRGPKEPKEPVRQLNPHDKGTESPGAVSVVTLNSMDFTNQQIMAGVPDHKFYIAFDFYKIDNDDYHRSNLYGYYQVKEEVRHMTLQLNHKSYRPANFPLQTQPELIKPGQFCNQSTTPNKCKHEFCACTHLLKVKLKSLVELVLVDEATTFNLNHPMHLHGFYYRVVAMEKLQRGNLTVETVKQLDREGKIHRKLNAAPLKDTIIVPSGGYTVVRFYADNPGYWFFHCHFDKHAANGMALIFKVGQHKDFPKVPKNFPKCGNF